MLFWLVFGLWTNWPVSQTNVKPLGGTLILFLLLFLLGWAAFGTPIKGP